MGIRIGQWLMGIAALSGAANALAQGATPADFWLKRAEVEIAAAPQQASTDYILVQPSGLAVTLYLLSPTDERRVRAMQCIEKGVKAEAGRKLSAAQVHMAYIGGALAYARIGAKADALRMLAAAEVPSDAGPATEPLMETIGGGFSALFKAEIYVRIDDKAGFEKIGLNEMGARTISEDLRADGLDREADYVVDYTMKNLPAPTTQAFDMNGTIGDRRVERVRFEIDAGDLDGAAKSAAGVENDLPASDVYADHPGHYSCRAYLYLGGAYIDGGDMASFETVGYELLDHIPKDVWDSEDFFHGFLNLCIRGKDAESFARVAAAWEKQISSADPYHDRDTETVRYLAQLAAQYAAIGDHAHYQWAVERATKLLASIPQRYESSQIQKRAKDFLWIAAAHARAGDSTAVAEDAAAALKAGIDDYNWDGAWDFVVKAYADAHLFPEALAAAEKSHYKEPKSYLLPYIVHRETEAGQFEDAWKMIPTIPGPHRISAEYDLIVHLVQAKQLEGLSARIDAMATPNERAIADLAVGATLLEKPYAGELRVYKPRPD